jgi:hypothetical protein
LSAARNDYWQNRIEVERPARPLFTRPALFFWDRSPQPMREKLYAGNVRCIAATLSPKLAMKVWQWFHLRGI